MKIYELRYVSHYKHKIIGKYFANREKAEVVYDTMLLEYIALGVFKDHITHFEKETTDNEIKKYTMYNRVVLAHGAVLKYNDYPETLVLLEHDLDMGTKSEKIEYEIATFIIEYAHDKKIELKLPKNRNDITLLLEELSDIYGYDVIEKVKE